MFELSTKSSSDAYRVYFFINVNAGLLVTMVRNPSYFALWHRQRKGDCTDCAVDV